MKVLTRFDNWHKTRKGHAVFAVIELLAFYLVGSRALDTGSWWEYGFALLLVIGSVQNIVQIFKKRR